MKERYDTESSVIRLKELFNKFDIVIEIFNSGKRRKSIKLFMKTIAFNYSEKELSLAYFKFLVFPEFLKALKKE